jgi:hypothetical protein
MLRQIVSVSLTSLAITACASLIPIKASAARLILIPVQPLDIRAIQRNPGDSLEFILRLEEIGIRNPVEIQGYSVDYDRTELSLVQIVGPIRLNQLLTHPTDLARYIFEVLESVVKDGKGDISATVNYRVPPYYTTPEQFKSIGTGSLYDVEPIPESLTDVEPVPEPLTILGAATALGYGAILKRQSFKNKKS